MKFFRSITAADPPDDAALLERYQRSREPADLSPLYDRYLELIYGNCLHYLGTTERAEDATAAVFEELLRKLPGQRIETFRAWLRTFVRNFCLMQLRREKRDPLRQTAAHEIGSDLMQSAAAEHPDYDLDPADTTERHLKDCLQQLNDLQRDCIRQFYYQDRSYREIAETLQLATGRVRSHLQNGRRNLRRCLEEKSGD